jgi:coenzyme PQQ precursor peptide PqqA
MPATLLAARIEVNPREQKGQQAETLLITKNTTSAPETGMIILIAEVHPSTYCNTEIIKIKLLETAMQWSKPEFIDLRFGFEITMYIANR